MIITEFKETQRFKRLWPWLALFVVNGILVYAIIQQVIIGKPFGNEPMSDTSLLLIELIPLGLLIFIFLIKLDTNISDEGIRYRYSPFQSASTLIEWEDLSDAYLRKYSSFYEYGGWGERVGHDKKNRAINTSASCNVGLQLEFKNGERLLIGTRKPQAIKEILDKLSAAGKIGWKA